MTVRIEKPALNLREEINRLDKPTGIAGEAMLRAETVAEQQALIGVGRRNLLINGGFDVWQRGTSFTPTGANPYTADRWLVYQSSTSNVTVTKRTESTSSSVPFINYIRLDDTIDADTSWIELNQYVEDYSHLINNTVTVSFWAKASYDIQDGYIYTNAGTISGAYAITTSWTKYQVTLDLKAGTVASDGYLRLLLGTQTLVAADSYIDYAQVQLELGKVATPFEHRSYGEELALCQRYCYVIDGTQGASTGEVSIGHGVWNGTNGAYIGVQMPTRMYELPTIDYGNLAWYRVVAEAISWRGLTALSVQSDSSSPHYVTLFATASSDTRGLVARMTTQSIAAKLIFDAEI